jgi:hypothetical protein
MNVNGEAAPKGQTARIVVYGGGTSTRLDFLQFLAD